MDDSEGASEQRVKSLRTYTWWSLTLMSSCLLVPLMVQISVLGWGVPTWLLLVAAVVASAQRTRLIAQAMRETAHRRRTFNELTLSAICALAVWTYAGGTQPAPLLWSAFPALIFGSVIINLPTRSRWIASTALVLSSGVVCAATSPLHSNDQFHPLVLCALAMGISGVFIVVDVAQLWLWGVVVEVDRARAAAGKLAVAHERLRFAYDLHDVQGHHLQAIVLKGELVERLIGRDEASARSQAHEVAELAREALTQTREMVDGYRSTDLITEITNATELLRAAGVRTSVEGDVSSIPPPLQQLFGTLVREGTTNVLRHSSAQRCELVFTVTATNATVRLSNDGVTAEGGEGNGITGLRERFATFGGHLVSGVGASGQFELTGRAPVSVGKSS